MTEIVWFWVSVYRIEETRSGTLNERFVGRYDTKAINSIAFEFHCPCKFLSFCFRKFCRSNCDCILTFHYSYRNFTCLCTVCVEHEICRFSISICLESKYIVIALCCYIKFVSCDMRSVLAKISKTSVECSIDSRGDSSYFFSQEMLVPIPSKKSISLFVRSVECKYCCSRGRVSKTMLPCRLECLHFASSREVSGYRPTCSLHLQEEGCYCITPASWSGTFYQGCGTRFGVLYRHDVCFKPIPFGIIEHAWDVG